LPTAEILSQGDEVVTGQVADTNAAWLSQRLTNLGFTVIRHTSVGDRLADIVAAVRSAMDHADLVLSTGGLGPTEDDLTAQAVALALGTEQVFDEQAMQQIEAIYARFGRTMPEINRKQAWLPGGATRIENRWGTAPGFAISTDETFAAFMPGVPREMRQMFEHGVRPLVQERFHVLPGRLVTLRTTGTGESNLQERIGTFAEPDVVLSFRTKLPENHIKLRFAPHVPPERVVSVSRELAARIGSPVFCIEGVDDIAGDLAHVVVGLLVAAGSTVATAESCTGGRVAAGLTSVAGSSAVFLEGIVSYSNAAKVRLLGVPQSLLQAHGAVSEPVARHMAQGARERAGSDYALSTTGIAGPGGGTETKPVGTVHIALATPSGTHHRALFLHGDRDRVQALSTAAVLDLLRRHLQGVLSSS
jgi:nicotinamide-nucleotide amidase